MPVRNDATMLRNCLTDIENQSMTDYELVVVDDGSTDETSDLLIKASQRDSRIRIICTEPHGIVSALNSGLTECKGQYIARMDVDDRMHKTRLQKQLEFMRNNPELELIGCRVEGFTDKVHFRIVEFNINPGAMLWFLMNKLNVIYLQNLQSYIQLFLQRGNCSIKLAVTLQIHGQRIMTQLCGHTEEEQN